MQLDSVVECATIDIVEAREEWSSCSTSAISLLGDYTMYIKIQHELFASYTGPYVDAVYANKVARHRGIYNYSIVEHAPENACRIHPAITDEASARIRREWHALHALQRKYAK